MGCGLQQAEIYHRVNFNSPGVKLCQHCAKLLGQLREAMLEEPGEYCAGCIGRRKNLKFARLPYPHKRPGECNECLSPVYPLSKLPIAALPPGVTPPGEIQGRYAAAAPLTAAMVSDAWKRLESAESLHRKCIALLMIYAADTPTRGNPANAT